MVNFTGDFQTRIQLILLVLQWVIVDSKVYDLSKFKNLHPGGGFVLTEVGGWMAVVHDVVLLELTNV